MSVDMGLPVVGVSRISKDIFDSNWTGTISTYRLTSGSRNQNKSVRRSLRCSSHVQDYSWKCWSANCPLTYGPVVPIVDLAPRHRE
jgi:hypothetical protein